jgi:hypothetical protein
MGISHARLVNNAAFIEGWVNHLVLFLKEVILVLNVAVNGTHNVTHFKSHSSHFD